MSVNQAARLEILNAVNNIQSESELNELRDLIAHFFADKMQKAVDHLWNEGTIDETTIEKWGNEHMRTSYK